MIRGLLFCWCSHSNIIICHKKHKEVWRWKLGRSRRPLKILKWGAIISSPGVWEKELLTMCEAFVLSTRESSFTILYQHTQTHTHTRMHTADTHWQKCIPMRIYTHIHAHIFTHPNTHVHTYTHVCTQHSFWDSLPTNARFSEECWNVLSRGPQVKAFHCCPVFVNIQFSTSPDLSFLAQCYHRKRLQHTVQPDCNFLRGTVPLPLCCHSPSFLYLLS